jgi:hypothetical protein
MAPRARGAPDLHVLAGEGPGITPACAGEHSPTAVRMGMMSGSPPRARGAGLSIAKEAAMLAARAGSHALQGLALLHAGEGYAMLGMRRQCEAALGAAEAHLQAMRTADPAHGLLSADRLGRIQGSCCLTLGDNAKAGSILESTARRLQGGHKSKAIILGNLALAHVRQPDLEQAATVLHRAIDLLEVSRGGGGLNVVSTAVRELRPWRQEPVVQDVQERLLALMTLN